MEIILLWKQECYAIKSQSDKLTHFHVYEINCMDIFMLCFTYNLLKTISGKLNKRNNFR